MKKKNIQMYEVFILILTHFNLIFSINFLKLIIIDIKRYQSFEYIKYSYNDIHLAHELFLYALAHINKRSITIDNNYK